MSILVIGGTSGIGKVIAIEFSGDAISSRTGHNVPDDLDRIINMSKDYDIIINCLPSKEQNLLLETLYNVHNELKLSTYFITVGSMSYKLPNGTEFKKSLFKFSEDLLFKKSTVKHTLINPAWCFNAHDADTAPLTLIRENELIATFRLLLATKDWTSVISMLEIKGI